MGCRGSGGWVRAQRGWGPRVGTGRSPVYNKTDNLTYQSEIKLHVLSNDGLLCRQCRPVPRTNVGRSVTSVSLGRPEKAPGIPGGSVQWVGRR